MKEIRDHIDAITRRAAKDASVDPKGEPRRELASHLFDLASNRALGRPVTVDDVDAAWAELAPQAIYLLQEDDGQTKAIALGAASWIPRFAAYVADVAGLIVAAATIIVPLNYIPVVLPERGIVLFVGVMFAGLVFALTAFEVGRGATPGKLLLGLRTVDANGESPSWVRAWIITIPKVFPPLLVADVLLGVLTGLSARRRLTERIVNLSVIQVN